MEYFSTALGICIGLGVLCCISGATLASEYCVLLRAMSPFNFPSSVVQKVVAIGMDCGVHMQPIAQEPSGFFLASTSRLESVVTKVSPEVFAKIFRVSFGREREAILALMPSGDSSLCRGLPPLPSAGVSLALGMGTTRGEIASLLFFFVFPVGFRIPCPSIAMLMPMYGGADT